jgi:hypothetical protein
MMWENIIFRDDHYQKALMVKLGMAMLLLLYPAL